MNQRTFLIFLIALSCSQSRAQVTATLVAATAQQAGKPEVRLRWQPGATGLPPRGYRLYRTDGTRRMVTQSSAPATPELSRFSNPTLRTQALRRAQLQPIDSLGATDSQVAEGVIVSYELTGIDAAGKESPLAALKDFRVGVDLAPPKPTGLIATQQADEVSLRWNRLSETQEQALNGVSYRLQRDSKPLHKKPLVILDNQESESADEFFLDTLETPGQVTYQLTLVDGFGRTSSAATLPFTLTDWRRPSEIPLAVGQLDELKLRSTSLMQRQPFVRSMVTAHHAQITWLPAQGTLSPIRYLVYRQDLDSPTAPPARLTPTPIEGTPVPTTPELLDDLLGEVSLEDDASRAERLAVAKQRARLSAQLRANPARRFTDTTVQQDRRYRYLVTALFTINNLETEPTQTVPVEVPTSAAPGAPMGLGGAFQPAPAASSERVTSATIARLSQLRPSATLRKQLPSLRAQQPLSFLTRDEGGTVTLRWNLPTERTGLTYRLTRKDASSAEAPTLLGITKPNISIFLDRVARGGAHRYTYTLTPISRWGVVGPPTTITVDTPATIAPTTPVIVLAAPEEGGGMKLTLQTSSPLESVSEYLVRVDNRPVAHTIAASAESVTLTVANAPSGNYTVVARNTAANLSSPPSEPLRLTPLAVELAAPAGLRANAGNEGVSLSWAAVPGALGYVISRREPSGAFIRLGGRVQAPLLQDVTALSRKTYTYRVVAIGVTGNLSAPTEVTVTTL